MRLTFYLLLLLSLKIKLSNGRDNIWLDFFQEEIVRNVKPYQIVIFTSKQFRFISYDFIRIELMKVVPCIIVEQAEQSQVTRDNKLLSLPAFENPRQVAVYILFYCGMHTDEAVQTMHFKNFIDYFIPFSQKYPRPRCLAFYINVGFSSESFFKNILKYAWSKKFLDFTIMELIVPDSLHNIHRPIVYIFNPFFDKLTKKQFDQNTQIFPDKLDDANGYPLRLPVVNDRPYIQFTKNSEGSIEDVHTPFLFLLTITADKMNFSIEFIDGEVNDTSVAYPNLFAEKLLNDDLDMLAVLMPLMLVRNLSDLVAGFGCVPFVAIVPIAHIYKINIPTEIYIHLFIISVILTITLYGAHLLHISRGFRDTFYILQVLFGIPVYVIPRRLSERLIFTSIIFLSIHYCTEFYSKCLDISIVKKEVPFDTIEEIAESPFDVYINDRYYTRIFGVGQESIMKLKEKIKPIKDVSYCVAMMKEGKRVICITFDIFAKYFADSHNNLMKIAKPVISRDILVYTAGPSFPYAEKFVRTFHVIHSSGVQHFETEASTSYEEETKYVNTNFINQTRNIIMIIMSSGYIISTIAFVMELILKPSLIKRYSVAYRKRKISPDT